MPHVNMQRIVRRELKSSRAVTSLVVAVVVSLACLYGLLECGLKLVNQPPWLIDPQQALQSIARLPGGVSVPLLGVVGALLLLLGIIFGGKALSPGRRARHTLPLESLSVVVDDEVIASALARRVRAVAAVTREQVMVTIGQKVALVTIRPTSGMSVDESAVTAAVEAEIAHYGIVPRPRVRLVVASHGAVGV